MNALEQLEQLFKDANSRAVPLNERMRLFREGHSRLRPDMFEAYDRLVDRIEIALSDMSGPGVGDRFPEFLLPDATGVVTKLSDILENGPAFISFNRGHWCHYCRLELRALADAYPASIANGGAAVCIVPERQEFSKHLAADCKLPFPVLSDIDHSLALELGLVVSVGDELRDLYLDIGFDFSEYHGSDGWFLPIPANYIVDQTGTIKARVAIPDFRDRIDPGTLVEMAFCGSNFNLD